MLPLREGAFVGIGLGTLWLTGLRVGFLFVGVNVGCRLDVSCTRDRVGRSGTLFRGWDATYTSYLFELIEEALNTISILLNGAWEAYRKSPCASVSCHTPFCQPMEDLLAFLGIFDYVCAGRTVRVLENEEH